MKELDLVAVLNKTFELYGRMLRETAARKQETEADLIAFSNDMDMRDVEADRAEPREEWDNGPWARRVDYDSD